MLPDVNVTNSARRAFLTAENVSVMKYQFTYTSFITRKSISSIFINLLTKHVIKMRITLCWFAQKDITHRLETDLRLLGHEMFSVGFRNARQVQ